MKHTIHISGDQKRVNVIVDGVEYRGVIKKCTQTMSAGFSVGLLEIVIEGLEKK